ncbi:hypothetical protein [Streptomyces dubilierae]|uniref:Uncharacterized protein n=1 Tax=Streptomyces dubilierae TaxID=3075533 RepID=A0ABU2P6J4_9ACTN|nr:hypothetical protein [Streptomyces sp. DSM 41921]MDT0386400.1 hypothetical protein [Streptomyces sp. DSM 41921]
MRSAYWKAQPALTGGLMVRRRGAALVGLLACLLMLHLLAPGPAGAGPASVTGAAADILEPGAASGDAAERAEEPCPCEDEPSARRLAARTPRAAGAAGASAVVAGAPRTARGGPSAAAGRCPAPGGAVHHPVELRAFRC